MAPPSAAGSSASALEAKAAAYAEAARRWATLARDVTRDLKGSDSPAYQAWVAAFDDGVWDLDGGAFDFHARWVSAGLARHPYCHRELA